MTKILLISPAFKGEKRWHMSLHEVPGDYFKRRKTDYYEPTCNSNTAFSLCMTLNLDEIGVIDNYVILTIHH